MAGITVEKIRKKRDDIGKPSKQTEAGKLVDKLFGSPKRTRKKQLSRLNKVQGKAQAKLAREFLKDNR